MRGRRIVLAATIAAEFATWSISGQCTKATTIDVEIGIDVSTTQAKVRAPGYMELLDDAGRQCAYPMTAKLKIVQDSPALIFESTVAGYSGSTVSIEGPAQVGSCYTSSIDARGEGLRDVRTAGPACWIGPPECDTCPRDSCEVDPQACNNSPLVLRVASGSYRMTGLEDPAHFDIDADGHLENVGWLPRDSAQGFLALDRNLNGVIDDARELFGNHTPLPDGSMATNGFEALAELDSNHDGVIDSEDVAWRDLRLWVDVDHDAASASSELSRLDDLAITWLAYNYHTTNRRDPRGNVFRYQSEFGLGRTVRTYYDVYLVTAP